MKRLSSLLLLCCMALSAMSQNFGYRNPVLPGFYPDPSVCRVGDDFYMVNSTFGYFPGVPVFHSKDLINWQQIGNVLDRDSQLWLGMANAQMGIYAPQISYHDGLFYMVTTNISVRFRGMFTGKEEKANFLVYATDPAGPWSEPVWLDQQGIDPSLFWEDGHCYMVSNPDGYIALCEINPTTGEQLSASKVISRGTGNRCPEGPHLYKKDGWYYLLLAEGGTELAHSVTILRSRFIDGPYDANPANPILTHCSAEHDGNAIRGTGHADLVEAPDGSWWMVCLGYRLQTAYGGEHHLLGRETMLAPVRWDKGAWPVVNGDGHIDLDMQVPTLPQVPADNTVCSGASAGKPLHYDWRKQAPGFEWLYSGNPLRENYRQTGKGLQLTATTERLDVNSSHVSFIARRQQHSSCTVQTRVSMTDFRTGDEAGLTTFMTFGGHYDVCMRIGDDGKATAVLQYTLGNMKACAGSVAIDARKPLVLRITAQPDYYCYSVSQDNGRTFSELGRLDCKFLSTETIGGFTGIVFGMYAQGNGEETDAKATFEYFDYIPTAE